MSGDILDEANEEELAAALSLSGSPEDMRKNITTFLLAVGEVFHAKGVYPPQLRMLLGALEDLDRGVVHPILKPSSRPASSQLDPTTHWEARAALVLALEARMALGESRMAAAKAVMDEIGYTVPGGRRGADRIRSLFDWKDRFGRQGRGSAPRDGEHWDVLAEGRSHLSRCDTLKPAERRAELARFYEQTLRHARMLLSDQPLKPGGRSRPITG
jgi:hypothetical protein